MQPNFRWTAGQTQSSSDLQSKTGELGNPVSEPRHLLQELPVFSHRGKTKQQQTPNSLSE